MSGNFTLFLNDAGTQTGSVDYVRDVFKDLSLPATSQSGFSTSTVKNPFNGFYGNDDAPKYGAKTLFVKDIVLEQDRTKWVNGKPLYNIVWNENYPGVNGYVEGVVKFRQSNQTSFIESTGLDATSANPVITITTTGRRVAFIVYPDSGTGTAWTVAVDGAANGTTYSPNTALPVYTNGSQNFELGRRNAVFVHAAANETKDIHSYQINSGTRDLYRFQGVIVYFENSGINIDCYPGTTYVDKNKTTSTLGATLAIPALGSSLGGRSVVYKTTSGTYSTASVAASMLQTVAVGTSGQNTMTVTTGQGASFFAGCGVVAVGSGSSQIYVGSVVSQSTDTLTISPTLSFGVSGLMYKAWMGHSIANDLNFGTGSSQPISASFYTLKAVFGFTQILGFSGIYPGQTSALSAKYFSDPDGVFSVWGNNIGVSNINFNTPVLGLTLSANSFLQIDGRFSALEIVFAAGASSNISGNLYGNFMINGCPGATINLSTIALSSVKIPVVYDAGVGWNSVVFNAGVSFGNWGIKSIAMYERNDVPAGISFGKLAYLDTMQTTAARTAINATLMALGTWKRYYAEELYFKGGWGRGITFTVPGTVTYYGTSTNAQMLFQYYGKNFALVGSAGGGTVSGTLDGGAIAVNFNTVTSVPTEGFHNLVVSVTGLTPQVHAIDVMRTYDEVRNVQNFTPMATGNSFLTFGEVTAYSYKAFGSTSVNIIYFEKIKSTSSPAPVLVETDSGLGTRMTILKNGFYQVMTHLEFSGATDYGITVNQSNLSATPRINTNIEEIVVLGTTQGANSPDAVCRIKRFNAGDVLRVGGNTGTGVGVGASLSQFSVVYLGDQFFPGG